MKKPTVTENTVHSNVSSVKEDEIDGACSTRGKYDKSIPVYGVETWWEESTWKN
jgi:hypothetical protein